MGIRVESEAKAPAWLVRWRARWRRLPFWARTTVSALAGPLAGLLVAYGFMSLGRFPALGLVVASGFCLLLMAGLIWCIGLRLRRPFESFRGAVVLLFMVLVGLPLVGLMCLGMLMGLKACLSP